MAKMWKTTKMLSPYVCITGGPSWFCRTLLFFALAASFFSQHVVPANVCLCQSSWKRVGNPLDRIRNLRLRRKPSSWSNINFKALPEKSNSLHLDPVGTIQIRMLLHILSYLDENQCKEDSRFCDKCYIFLVGKSYQTGSGTTWKNPNQQQPWQRQNQIYLKNEPNFCACTFIADQISASKPKFLIWTNKKLHLQAAN